MITELEPLLKPFHRHLLVVLDSGRLADEDKRSLPAVIASCYHGPYDLTRWLRRCASNLGPNDPVHLAKEGHRKNWIEVLTEPEPLRFAPYFASIDKQGNYCIHPKGKEVCASGVNPKLFEFEDEATAMPEECYPYALRILENTERYKGFALHMIFGDRPDKHTFRKSKIRAFGRPYIVRFPDATGAPAEVVNVPFAPQPK